MKKKGKPGVLPSTVGKESIVADSILCAVGIVGGVVGVMFVVELD